MVLAEALDEPQSPAKPGSFTETAVRGSLQVHEPLHDKDGQLVVPEGVQNGFNPHDGLFGQGIQQSFPDKPRRRVLTESQVNALLRHRNSLVMPRHFERTEGVVLEQLSFWNNDGKN